MKQLFILLLVLLIGVSSCRNNNNNATPSAAVWGDLVVQVRSSDSNFIFPSIYDETASAEFFSAANSYWLREPVTRVSANDANLSDNFDTQYVDQPGPGINNHVLWEVVGTNNVPSFTYDDIGIYPGYNGPMPPDTIIALNGFSMSFPLSTLTADDSVRIVWNEYTVSQFKELGPNRMITFTPTDLSTLPPGDNYMNIVVYRPKHMTFSGKGYYIAKERIYMRNVFVQ